MWPWPTGLEAMPSGSTTVKGNGSETYLSGGKQVIIGEIFESLLCH